MEASAFLYAQENLQLLGLEESLSNCAKLEVSAIMKFKQRFLKTLF